MMIVWIIIIFLILLWLLGKVQPKPEELIDRSNGTWDEPARQAEAALVDATDAVDVGRRGRLRALNRNDGVVTRDVADDFRQALHLARQHPDADNGDIVHWVEEAFELPWLDVPADMMGQIMDDTPLVAAETRDMRRAEVAAVAENHEQFTQGMLDRAAVIASDAQNVHDTQVVDGTRDTWRRISGGRRATDDELYDICAESPRANRALEAIFRADTPVYRIGASTVEILRTIAARAADHRNDNLRQALRAAIEDTMEGEVGGNLVCPTGVSARLIGALTLTDRDRVVAEPVLSQDMIRRDTFEAVGRLIEAQAAELSGQDTPLGQSAAAYRGQGDVPLTQFVGHMRPLVEAEVRQRADGALADRLIAESMDALE